MRGGTGYDSIYFDGDAGEIVVSGTTSSVNYGIMGETDGDYFIATQTGKGVAGITVSNGGSGTIITASNFISDFDPNGASEKIDLRELTNLRDYGDLGLTEWLLGSVHITQVRAGNGTDAVYITLYNVSSAAINGSHFILPDSVSTYGSVTDGNDNLIGNAEGNVLDGSLGADVMEGRTGDDTYIVDNAGDNINELPGGGFDTVRSSVTFTLEPEIENLALTGVGNLNGTGNELGNRISGTRGNNLLDGKGGVDTLLGGAGNDVYQVDAQADSVIENAGEGIDTVQSSVTYTLGANLENLTLTGVDAVNATGNTLNNTITGNAADNTLDGVDGADTMLGGLGDDTYFVNIAGDIVTENAAEGIDTVCAAINATLGANVENLILGVAATTGIGNALDNQIVGNALNNTLTGNAGNDWLDGKLGADTLTGGAGDDTYLVGTGDTIVEALNEGADTVLSSITYTLGANVENITLSGTAAINGIGNTLNNVLTGNSAVNTLTGGAGNDTYVISTGDIVVEAVSAGTDTVQSDITYTLGANVENLTLFGTMDIDGTGNALNNVLTGNAAVNTLSGGIGADTMIGGAGNDTYVVDNTLDVVTEVLNEGIDTVQSSVTYTLVANVENARILATGVANLTGNTLNNVLYAGNGVNAIDGGTGTDTLPYLYSTSTDTSGVILNLSVVNAAGQSTAGGISGADLVKGIENLSGSNYADTLTGNAVNNVIKGGTGNDNLNGGAGNDTLNGGAGKDSLTGGSGNDLFDFNTLSELGLSATRDVITDFTAGLDKIDLATIDSNVSLAGDQAFAFVSAFTATAGQVRYSGGIVYFNTDADTLAEYEIQLSGIVPTTLSATDFVL